MLGGPSLSHISAIFMYLSVSFSVSNLLAKEQVIFFLDVMLLAPASGFSGQAAEALCNAMQVHKTLGLSRSSLCVYRYLAYGSKDLSPCSITLSKISPRLYILPWRMHLLDFRCFPYIYDPVIVGGRAIARTIHSERPWHGIGNAMLH